MCLSFTFPITQHRQRFKLCARSLFFNFCFFAKRRTSLAALSRISLSIRYQNETKTCWKAVAQQWLVCSKAPESYFHHWPKLHSAMQFPKCHLQGKGERCLAVVFSGDPTAPRNSRESKAKRKWFWGPCLKCTHRLKHGPLKQYKIYHSFSTKLLPCAPKFTSQLSRWP